MHLLVISFFFGVTRWFNQNKSKRWLNCVYILGIVKTGPVLTSDTKTRVTIRTIVTWYGENTLAVWSHSLSKQQGEYTSLFAFLRNIINNWEYQYTFWLHTSAGLERDVNYIYSDLPPDVWESLFKYLPTCL